MDLLIISGSPCDENSISLHQLLSALQDIFSLLVQIINTDDHTQHLDRSILAWVTLKALVIDDLFEALAWTKEGMPKH